MGINKNGGREGGREGGRRRREDRREKKKGKEEGKGVEISKNTTTEYGFACGYYTIQSIPALGYVL